MTIRSLLWVLNDKKPRVVKNKNKTFMMRKFFFKKSSKYLILPERLGNINFYENERRRVISS